VVVVNRSQKLLAQSNLVEGSAQIITRNSKDKLVRISFFLEEEGRCGAVPDLLGLSGEGSTDPLAS
jgi:hypothetical protein